MEQFDIAIIGTGPAGISAAITAKLRNKSVVLFGSEKTSSKIEKSMCIENYPGLPEISGSDFSKRLSGHLEKMQVNQLNDRINAVYAMGKYFSLQGSGNSSYEAKSVILATGVNFGNPVDGEEKFLGRGVSYCATCDGNFYKGKKVAVLAYDREAESDAKYLSELCQKVVYVKLYAGDWNPQIESIETVVDAPVKIEGSMKVESLQLRKKTYDVDGVFIIRKALRPNQLVPGLVLDESHVMVDRQMRTNIPGLFACGDITGLPYQYVKAAGEGNVAALSAVAFLDAEK